MPSAKGQTFGESPIAVAINSLTKVNRHKLENRIVANAKVYNMLDFFFTPLAFVRTR